MYHFLCNPPAWHVRCCHRTNALEARKKEGSELLSCEGLDVLACALCKVESSLIWTLA